MLELAHECKHLTVLHHVSTAYVNTNQPFDSVVPEEILPWGKGSQSYEASVRKIVDMEPQMLEREEKNILREMGFPNTYTYTKNLAEQALQANRRPDLRIVISRPSIITGTYRFPFEGWTDTVSAAGSVTYPYGMGM